ncbi:hypothetical protein AB833_17680 [Chromatiales bacterium (ex Bugula neritina AB1)]|nr:hypothetical protein AB833_17680 [Chromatiales bacterium (ex Bugula neritina AB1)]
MKKLTSFITLYLIFTCQYAIAGQLYLWHGRDGTPTYSPEPPPKGVAYTVVGDNLEPLKNQPAAAIASKSNTGESSAPKTIITNQITDSSVKPAKWKPVRYANDPSLKRSGISVAKSKTVVQSAIGTPLAYETEECIGLKQTKLILESQFARATSDTQMDEVILKLREHQSAYDQRCKN